MLCPAGLFLRRAGEERKSKHRQNAQGSFGQERKKQKNQDENATKSTRRRVCVKNGAGRKIPLKNPKMA